MIENMLTVENEIPKPLEPVIKLLVKNYTTDMNLPYIKNPIAHSLHETWKHFDAKKGKWKLWREDIELGGNYFYECSCCHEDVPAEDIELFSYCPACGAKMKEVKRDER